MAIITNSLKHLMAQAFIDKLSSSNNAFFFIGKSTPWQDKDAHEGFGTLNLVSSSTTLSISGAVFTSDILGATIRNLLTGETRLVTAFSPSTPNIVTVNAPPSIPWTDLTSWAWKSAAMGSAWIDDSNPQIADTSLYNINSRDNDMLALKKLDLTSLDNVVSFVIPRYNYEADTTVYAPYKDNDGNLLNHPIQNDIDEAAAYNSDPSHTAYKPGPHFVLVQSGSNLNVFKCLSNGGKYNISTVAPDKTQCNSSNRWIHSASDGYKWKFMYSLSADQALNFLSESWIPVRLALPTDTGDSELNQYEVQAAAVPGSIEAIDVIRSTTTVPYFGDMVAGTTLGDQTGMGTTEVSLPASASGVDGYYTGCEIYVFSTVPQKRTIIGYVGATHVATISDSWDNQPLNTDKACIAPIVTVSGLLDDDGIPAVARAIVTSGIISEIKLINIGQNYRLATARALVGSTEVAELKAQVSPQSGHGSNAIKELGGYNLMIHTSIKNVEGIANSDSSYDFMTDNDYRTVGIILDVKEYAGTYPSTVPDTMKAVQTLKVVTSPSTASFEEDEIIQYLDSGSTVVARGYVVQHIKDVDSALGYDTLSFIQDEESGFDSFSPVTGGVLKGVSSGTEATISELEAAEIKHFSGDIIYLYQRKRVSRQEKQVEDIKLVLEF